jgi:hypothetical protein
MTEAEWLACDDPAPMMEFLRGKGSDRKLRLFGCSCCRANSHLFLDGALLAAVETAEGVADGLPTQRQCRMAKAAAFDVLQETIGWRPEEADDLLRGAEWELHFENSYIVNARITSAVAALQVIAARMSLRDLAQVFRMFVSERGRGDKEERRRQAELSRCIFGNIFRATPADSTSPVWHSSTVRQLALSAYGERVMPQGALDSARLAVLADALEDAGCTDAAVLNHCRSPGPHVRGCWVVDLILGKS